MNEGRVLQKEKGKEKRGIIDVAESGKSTAIRSIDEGKK